MPAASSNTHLLELPMKLTAPGVAKIIGALGTLVAAGAGGARIAHAEHEDQLAKLAAKLDALETTSQKNFDALASDIRLLKCANDFPGDCPGQAKLLGPLPPRKR